MQFPHIAKDYAERVQQLPFEWQRFESQVRSEAKAIKAARLATDSACTLSRTNFQVLQARLDCAISGTVQLAGVASLRDEERVATKAYLEDKAIETYEFLNGCIVFKRKNLRPSVRAMIPLLNPKTGHILRFKSGGAAHWK